VGLNWKDYYRLDPRFHRPTEPQNLLGNASLAERELGWKHQTSLQQLAALMVDHDLALLKNL
jgi:GDPmannose 4,6-dehydratase